MWILAQRYGESSPGALRKKRSQILRNKNEKRDIHRLRRPASDAIVRKVRRGVCEKAGGNVWAELECSE
jgi:hypothetical protein